MGTLSDKPFFCDMLGMDSVSNLGSPIGCFVRAAGENKMVKQFQNLAGRILRHDNKSGNHKEKRKTGLRQNEKRVN